MTDAYLDHLAARRPTETPGAGGQPDGAGWMSRTLPDGTVEYWPEGESPAPEGYIWQMDDAGGPIMGAGGRKRYQRVPKLREIVSTAVRPSRRPDVHFDSATGERYR